MMNPWLGMGLVLGALTVLMGALHAYGARCHPHPEVPRKLLHVGMGLVTLTFPWLFAATWPVWTLAGLSALLLGALKLPSPLQRRLGGVLDGVARASLGDLYFPLSVAIVFQLTDRDPLLYCIPLLLLTLADAVAALIGIFYGHVHYPAVGGWKSVEGSIAFFLVAFFSTHVPLLLFSQTGRVESLLLGVTIGLLVMLIEAVAWNGLDNLLVPVGGYFLLVGYLQMDAARLTTLLLATVLWVACVFLLRRRSTLNDGALFGAALVGYLTWSLGGWPWLLPPLIFYLAYPLVWPIKEFLRQRPHDIHAVVAITGPGLLLLAFARSFERWELLFPYAVGYAAQLAFISIGHKRECHSCRATAGDIGMAASKSWCILLLPCLLVQEPTLRLSLHTVLALGIVWAVTTLFNRVLPPPGAHHIERFPWLPQAVLGALASGVSMGVMALGH
jgi:phytol kinase